MSEGAEVGNALTSDEFGGSPALLEQLIEWLRIPSISTGESDPAEMRRAAEWAREKIRSAGGEAELDERFGVNPLVVGELRAADPDAPTVLIYGHYDVQSVGEESAWTTPPFEPTIREGRLYARGAADDKGNFFPLLFVACELASAGRLPVNVRVLIEGEEETTSAAVIEFVESDGRGADCAIVFDSGAADERTPAITLGLRGAVVFGLEVRTGERDLHSGLYGGSVLNALHVLTAMLAEIAPGPDGRVREELRAGIAPPGEAELESWRGLDPGEEVIAGAGGRPVSPEAGAEYYLRNGADASVEINEIVGGEPRTVVPSTARATVSMRLAPDQDAEAMQAELERLLRGKAPDGAEVEFRWGRVAEPTLVDADSPAVRLASEALGRACGVPAALIRSGGSIPVVAALVEAGIPTITGGFGLDADAIHAPNESYRLEALRLGEASARELYVELAKMPRRGTPPRN